MATNRPTPQFERHHDVTPPQVDGVAFRTAWLVHPRVRGLYDAGRIGRAHLDAADTFRRWAETTTPVPAQGWTERVDCSMTARDLRALKTVSAAARLRACTEALGALRVKLIEALVVRDVSWRELARLLGVSDKTAMGHAVEALEALADWFAGRDVSAPPRIRYRIEPGRQ